VLNWVRFRAKSDFILGRQKKAPEAYDPFPTWQAGHRHSILIYDNFDFPSLGGLLSSEHVERRLAVILAADVAGSCRLIGADEGGTLARLRALRKTIFDPKIAKHHGRIVKNTGDGALVEFASVVNAARCADDIQRSFAEHNIDVPLNKRIEMRIGVHAGDIIIDENDIFGDAANIAVRLEEIAEPGGVCISDDVRRQVRGKIDIAFDDMGWQSLKNIRDPVRAWRVRPLQATGAGSDEYRAPQDTPSASMLFSQVRRRSEAIIKSMRCDADCV
jgi:class 3 adenylate cyclase